MSTPENPSGGRAGTGPAGSSTAVAEPDATGPDPALAFTSTLKRRRREVPTVLQMEAVECGAASLAMVLAAYGRWVPLEELRVACGVSRNGANARNLLVAARQYGMEAHGFRRELHELPDEPFPVIAFWEFNHFVVVEGVSRKGLHINDPASGRRVVPWEDADRSFTGISLHVEPGPTFTKGGRPPSATRGLLDRLRGSWPAVWFVMLAGLGLVVPSLAVPVAVQIYIDQVLVEGVDSWAPMVAFGLIVALFLQWYLTWLQRVVTVRFDLRLGVTMADRFIRHALRLPMSFYAQRFAGDVAYRVGLNDEVAQILSAQLGPALLGAFTATLFLVLMIGYSPLLALVAVAAAAIDAVVLIAIRRRRVADSARLARANALYQGAAAYGLQTITTVKASGGEDDLFATVTGYQARLVTAMQRFQVPTIVVSALPAAVSQFANVAVLALGAALVLRGNLTVGTLVAFQVVLVNFLGPIGVLTNLGATIQQLRADLDRLDDLLNHKVDPVFAHEAATADAASASPSPAAAGSPAAEPSAHAEPAEPAEAGDPAAPAEPAEPPGGRLRGELELRKITFGYSRSDPPLIVDFDLRLTPGKRVAVVGATGSGKSTVAKLVCGLYQPWSGEVLLDGRPATDWPREVITSSLAFVDQDIVLFDGTVRENLAFWDATLPEDDLVAAAKDAAIHEEITARPGGYSGKVEEGGRNWSGGQCQRFEIARALATNPTVLVLDEATSALDPTTELAIDRNLRRRGCTMVVVAHRLSTIRDADEIVVLHAGKVVERGTHEELVALDGTYAALVRA